MYIPTPFKGGVFMSTDSEKIENWNQMLSNYWKSIEPNQYALLQDRINRLEKRKASMEQSIANWPSRADKASLLIEIEETGKIIQRLTQEYEKHSSSFESIKPNSIKQY